MTSARLFGGKRLYLSFRCHTLINPNIYYAFISCFVKSYVDSDIWIQRTFKISTGVSYFYFGMSHSGLRYYLVLVPVRSKRSSLQNQAFTQLNMIPIFSLRIVLHSASAESQSRYAYDSMCTYYDIQYSYLACHLLRIDRLMRLVG